MPLKAPEVTQLISELEFSTARSSGPGGQNVNKVNSKVVLRWDVRNSVITQQQKEVVLKKLHSRLTQDGVLMVVVQESRSQLQNKEAALVKLQELLRKAFEPKKVRKATKPGKAAKEKRIQEKRLRSEKKQWRQRPD